MNRPNKRRCDGIQRREVLRIGALTGLGFGLVDYFRRQTIGAESKTQAKACILLWLDGGPSHLETFDLKPHAPTEVRGPFQPIPTKVAGIQISELLPETAKVMQQVTLIRSLTSPLGEHGLANQYLLTGYEPSSVLQYPSFGSVLTHVRDESSVLPSQIAIPTSGGVGAGFLGSAREPFAISGDPAKPDFRVRDLDFFPQIDATRLARRRAFLQEFEQSQRAFEAADLPTDSAIEQAYRLVTSPQAKQAFDLTQEPAAIRSCYGPRTFGQSCLLARRLIERGVPFVTVHSTGWDTHSNLVLQLKEGYTGAKPGVGLLPTFDLGYSALISDLATRGLLDQTLVVAMGEFGRTPKLNSRGGRDHWPRVFSVAVAGGGIRGGQVIGASDRLGESPADQPVTPKDLAFSIYTLLGIDPRQELMTPDGRPVPINQGGQWIKGLT